MANSPNLRIALIEHEKAELIAIKMTAANQKIITKNEVLRMAVEIGLKEINKTYEKKRTKD